MPQTLYDKIWNEHLVHQQEDGTSLLFVDRHLIHEVTSPQAFEGLRNSKRKVRQPKLTLAVADHNVPTTDRSKGILDKESKIQVDTLDANCKEFGVQVFGMEDKRQGIVHIIGPEQGFTQPGTVIVCGDSHTATHGAFGALAFGIGTSEVEHVLVTQCLVIRKMKNMKVSIGLVIAIIVQAFGLIWYVAQLDSTVTNLDTSVGALQEQATTVDVAVLQKDLENIKDKITMMDEMHSMKFNPSELEEAIEDLEELINELEKRQAIIENEMRTIMSDHGGFAEVLKHLNASGLLPSGEKRSYGDYD